MGGAAGEAFGDLATLAKRGSGLFASAKATGKRGNAAVVSRTATSGRSLGSSQLLRRKKSCVLPSVVFRRAVTVGVRCKAPTLDIQSDWLRSLRVMFQSAPTTRGIRVPFRALEYSINVPRWMSFAAPTLRRREGKPR